MHAGRPFLERGKKMSDKPFRTYGSRGGGSIELYLADSMAAMSRMDPRSVDVVVTSPPYNIGKKYGVHVDRMPRHDYISWMESFGRDVSRILDLDGSLFLNVGGTLEDPWLPWDVARAVSNSMRLQNVIHWVKSISLDLQEADGSTSLISTGHFKPIVSKRYLNDFQEYVFHFTHDGARTIDKLSIGVPYKDKSNIGRWKSAGRDLRDRGNIWFIPYETIRTREQRPHPASFPVKLPEMCIRLHGLTEGLVVLDPFMGIGATAVACARLGVSFKGYEIDGAYLEESCRRLDMFYSPTGSEDDGARHQSLQ